MHVSRIPRHPSGEGAVLAFATDDQAPQNACALAGVFRDVVEIAACCSIWSSVVRLARPFATLDKSAAVLRSDAARLALIPSVMVWAPSRKGPPAGLWERAPAGAASPAGGAG